MILLQSGLNTKVDLTLTEKVTLNNPIFFIVFVNDSSEKKVACKISDVSSFPSRFNRFLINVKTSGAVALNGEVNLQLEGFYHYYCYERSDQFDFDLEGVDNNTIASLGETLETGKMLYAYDYQNYVKYINNKPSIKVYNG